MLEPLVRRVLHLYWRFARPMTLGVRGLALDVKSRDYICAAQTRGESPWYIMLWEILPNARGPLIVDAGIQPLDGSTRAGVSPEALADPRRIADAALFLANQDARSATHELQLTPLAENWTP